MTKILGYTFLAGGALAIAALVGGCSSSSSSSPPLVLSAAGESCTRTADCDTDFACVADVCVAKAVAGVGADGGIVLADAGVVADGGALEAAAPPRLGGVGESCLQASDCGAGLTCIPASIYGAGGVCDVASYGLKPTGKTCSGECSTGADCCELPLNTTVAATPVKTCQDILNLVLSGNTSQCTTPPAANSAVGIGCFLYSTYCASCTTSNVWSCTNSQCVYNLPCQNSGAALNGCPLVTRTSRTLPSVCDTMSNKCGSATLAALCSVSADCDGKATADAAGTCRGGDCTCFQSSCYLSCASTLDCKQGYTCNTGTKLCTQSAVCSSDAQCAVQTSVTDAKCVAGACKLPCTTDHDCGGSGLISNIAPYATNFSGQVCGSDGFCETLGCATDTDCQELSHNVNVGTATTVNYFCATPQTAPTTATPSSAITN